MKRRFYITSSIIVFFVGSVAVAGWEPVEATVGDYNQERSDYHNSGGTYEGTKTGEKYEVSTPSSSPTTSPSPQPRGHCRDCNSNYSNRESDSSDQSSTKKGTDSPTVTKEVAAALRGHQNAEWGYQLPDRAENKEQLFNTNHKVEYDYEMNFYEGSASYLKGIGLTDERLLEQNIITGPIHKKLVSEGWKINSIPEDKKKILSTVDALAREHKIHVSLPGKAFDGKAMDNLNNFQKYALRNSMVIVGGNAVGKQLLPLFLPDDTARETEATGGLAVATEFYLDLALGGVVLVNNSDSFKTGLHDETLAHELTHAGESTVYTRTWDVLNNENLNSEEMVYYTRAQAAAIAIRRPDWITSEYNGYNLCGLGNECADTSRALVAAVNSEWAEGNPYLMSLTEIHAIASQQKGGKWSSKRLADYIKGSRDGNFNSKRLGIKSVPELTDEEAEQIAEILVNSIVLKTNRKILNDFIKDEMARGN